VVTRFDNFRAFGAKRGVCAEVEDGFGKSFVMKILSIDKGQGSAIVPTF